MLYGIEGSVTWKFGVTQRQITALPGFGKKGCKIDCFFVAWARPMAYNYGKSCIINAFSTSILPVFRTCNRPDSDRSGLSKLSLSAGCDAAGRIANGGCFRRRDKGRPSRVFFG